MSEKPQPREGRSTRDEAVYGLPPVDHGHTKLVAAKWERINIVTEFLDGANDSEKNSFAGHYRNLRLALQTYLLCSERLLILFDSSTTNDIVQRKHNVRRRRFNSLLAALALAEDYCLADIFCCITPAVLYEMNGRQAIADAKAADDIIDYIASNMADIGLPLSYLGFSNLPQLFAAHRYIEDDQQAILKALRQLNQTDWTVDLSSMRFHFRCLSQRKWCLT